MTTSFTERPITHPSASNDEVILSVQGVSKKFCRNLKRSLFYGMWDIASEITGVTAKERKLRSKEFWALQNVSFELKRGEALGLVGSNGSGKTTLMRIIAGLIKPDTGSVEVQGRVAPLIALGAGFSPILTGRENIYANMSILGLTKKEIDERFQDVIDFAEIGDAIDAPVRSYSSGMAARLGFASAIHTEPDILLIDEVLAVGDVRFRSRCTRKLAEMRQHKGISFVFVSHNHDALLTVCDQGIYLANGCTITKGDIRPVLDSYENDLFLTGSNRISGEISLPEKSEAESTGLDILSVFFQDSEGIKNKAITSGQPISLRINLKSSKEFECVSFNIQIEELSGDCGQLVYMNSPDDEANFKVHPGKCAMQVQMPHLTLGAGSYKMRIIIRNNKNYCLDRVDSFRFAVKKADFYSYSKIYQPRSWELINLY